MVDGQQLDEAAQQALRGSRAAWDTLIGRHGRTVVVSLLARGVALDRAKDLAQAAWMRLIEQQRAGKLETLTLPGLAIAQAAFLAREEARQTRREAGLEDAAQVADGTATPEARALGKQQLERARRELATCSGTSREVFRLAYGDTGMPHAEIARRMGLSLQRVRQVLCELRRKLRQAIEEQDHG
jgi:RNA polymerase sigma-70 factor (ECF subfamily)